MQPQDIGTSLPASPLATTTDQVFVKDEAPQFGRAYFHGGRISQAASKLFKPLTKGT